MTILPDYLESDLRVVFCGTAVARDSAAVGHYYAGRGNEFWSLLYESGLTRERLTYEQDARILEFGIGLTDLAKYVVSSTDVGMRTHFDPYRFAVSMEKYRPRWIAFNGKTAASVAARALRYRKDLLLGPQPWTVAGIPVFVAPSSSSSNRDPNHWQNRMGRVDWFADLAKLLHKPDRRHQRARDER